MLPCQPQASCLPPVGPRPSGFCPSRARQLDKNEESSHLFQGSSQSIRGPRGGPRGTVSTIPAAGAQGTRPRLPRSGVEENSLGREAEPGLRMLPLTTSAGIPSLSSHMHLDTHIHVHTGVQACFISTHGDKQNMWTAHTHKQ